MKHTLSLSLLASLLFSAALSAQNWYPYKDDPAITDKQKAGLDAAMPARAAAAPVKTRRVLVFSRTCDFRHYQGIVTAKYVVEKTGARTGAWETVVSDDLANFEPAALRSFDCVVMNNTTGRPFAEPQPELKKMPAEKQAAILARDARLRENLLAYIREGGALFGIHAGGDTYRNRNAGEYNDAYIDMIGGNFIGHPWTARETSVITVEDAGSPVTRGIWPAGEFTARNELYMFGDAFDRGKLRVLMALDLDRCAPRKAARADRDCAVVWIKNYGKGRVAYSALGHDMTLYFMPEVQELHMRLLQFACGDLAADTTSIPKPKRPARPAFVTGAKPFFPAPAVAQIRALENCAYGPADADAIDALVFATYGHNGDAAFCATMEDFLLGELEKGAGTSRYRTLLAHLVEAVGVQKQADRLGRLAKAEKDEAVRSRLAEAAAHWKRAALKKEKELAIPSAKPGNARELGNIIGWLAANAWAPLPGWLTFDALDEAMKPRLAHALAERGEAIAAVKSLDPKTPELALAIGHAVWRRGGTQADLARLLSFAPLLDKKQAAQMAAYLASTAVPGRADLFAATLGAGKPGPAALAGAALALMDLTDFSKKFLAGYDRATTGEKQAMLKVCESLADEYVFTELMRRLPGEKDAALRDAAQRALTRISQALFTAPMFAATTAAYAKSDAAARAFCLRFAVLQGDADAAQFCKRAHADGLKNDALRTLGGWKNQTALDALLAIAKTAADERETVLAQVSLAGVMGRAGARADALEYVLKNAVRAEEKDAALKAAVKFPDKKIADWLAANGHPKQAEAVRAGLKKKK
ncbi:MAG: ThuA domain-containing protein [Opitutaceae bacterium]|jgi:type 1 glutamine amidotransferase|nr:ThuA domain-containing protein [Opitutaceae bacterium]